MIDNLNCFAGFVIVHRHRCLLKLKQWLFQWVSPASRHPEHYDNTAVNYVRLLSIDRSNGQFGKDLKQSELWINYCVSWP